MALCSFVFFRCFEKKLQLTSDEATCFSWGNHQPARPCSESAAETAAEHDSLGPGPAVVEKQLRPPPPHKGPAAGGTASFPPVCAAGARGAAVPWDTCLVLCLATQEGRKSEVFGTFQGVNSFLFGGGVGSWCGGGLRRKHAVPGATEHAAGRWAFPDRGLVGTSAPSCRQRKGVV